MSPERAYTVEPVVSTDESGEPTIQDFSVVSSSNRQDPNAWQDDWVMDSEGKYHHMFENVELEDESSSHSSFDEEAYISSLYEANPQLADAIEWGTDNLTQDQLSVYNQLVDSSDLNDVNRAVDWILEQYRENANQVATAEPENLTDEDESGSYLEDETIERIENLSDEDAEMLSDAVDDLSNTAPMGVEAANYWLDFAQQADESGNAVASLVATATAAYHRGELSAEEAISECLNQCDLQELADVYRQLNGPKY